VNLWRSSFHYTALMALEQAGVDETDVNFVLLPFANQPDALLSGDVDVIGLMEPYISAFEAQYGDVARPLFDAIDVFGEKQFTTHFVNRLWAEYNPEQAEAFTAGIVEAINWIEQNPEEAKPIIAQYTGIDEQYVPVYHFQPDGRVVEEDVAFWLEYLLGRGDVEADWLTPEQIASNRYNAEVQ
jgi:NitT/TauT family transport system substrate-binding protein